MQITFIGGGNMASALIGGLLQKGYAADKLSVMDISAANREQLHQKYGVAVFAETAPAVAAGEVIVLAVKPQQLFDVATQLRGLLHNKLVISIAAGVRTTDLSRWLGNHELLVRVMPNTPAMVMSGVSGLYAMPGVDAAQRARAEGILQAVGSTLWLDDENKMDAITAISGSGPAYVFYFIEALEEAAIELGLTALQARQLSIETFSGASRLASASKEDVATLRARVTSKNGTTERALLSMETNAVKQHIIEAVHAAAARSRELGDELGNI